MSLQSIIQQIKNATLPGENTALRVGSAFEQMDTTKRDKSDSLSASDTIDMINAAKLLAATGTPFLGTIDPTTTIPAGNFWAFAGEGTYPNANGIVVGAGEIAIITRVGANFDSVILDVPVRSIEDVEKTSTIGLVDTYTITYTDGSTPTTFEVTNGQNGVSVSPEFDKSTETEAQGGKQIFDFLIANKRSEEEILPISMFDHTLLNNGTYANLGANYKHTDYIPFSEGDKIKLKYFTNAVLGAYVGLFDNSNTFLEGLYPETSATGGWREQIFEATFDGKLIINSNFQATEGLPTATKLSQPLFATGDFVVGDFVVDKETILEINGTYSIDKYYEDSDNGDYGKTLNRIHSIMPATGGVITFTAKNYKISTKVIFTKSVVLKGLGKSEFYFRNWITGMYTDSQTLEMIDVIGGGNFFKCEGIHFYNTSVLPTAGHALAFKYGTAVGDGNPEILKLVSGAILKDCSFDGFFDNLHFSGACQFNMYNVLTNYAVRYNLYADAATYRDAGDSTIIGCNFYSWKNVKNRTTEAHIYQRGSGGLKIVGNKFNNLAKNCYLGNFPDNETSILLISANSFENYSENAIKITSTSTVGNIFRYVSIQGNEFAGYNDGTTDINFKNVKDSSIIGNVFLTLNTLNTSINLNTCDNIQLMNTYSGYTNSKNIYNSTNIKEPVLQDAIGTNINK